MIARIWRGAVRRADGDAYVEYMRETGVAGYASTPGNRGVWMLRREDGDRTELVMLTLWDSLDAVQAFAGGDYETAVFYPEDDRFLVERDLTASHYEVVGLTERPRAVVLVEGTSDRVALETLAKRRGRDLAAEGVAIVPMGGAQSIGRFLDRFGPRGLDVRLAGLCDAGEEREFRRALDRAGLKWLGFYVCVVDLEDELIRALGAPSVEEVVEAQGELGAFRTLQKQPAWRGRPVEEQLRRFMGSGGRRKIRYARLLVEALELERVPRPLDAVLARVT